MESSRDGGRLYMPNSYFPTPEQDKPWYKEPKISFKEHLDSGVSPDDIPSIPDLSPYNGNGGYMMLNRSLGCIKKNFQYSIELIEKEYQYGLIPFTILPLLNIRNIEALQYGVYSEGYEWGYYYPRHGFRSFKTGKLPTSFLEDPLLANSHNLNFLRNFPEYVNLQSDTEIYPFIQILGCRVNGKDVLYLYPETNNRVEMNICDISRVDCRHYSSPKFEPIRYR